MTQLTGNVYIVVAPSGTGKTSLVKALLEKDPAIELSVSYTTRAPRTGEVNGKHYHFVSVEDFQSKIDANDFLEYANVYGNFYGTSASWIQSRLQTGKDILLEIDWQGAEQVKKVFPEAISLFILPPSLAILEERLRGRATDADEVIERRLSEAKMEIAKSPQYDYLVVNDEFDLALDQMHAIFVAQRLRPKMQLPRLDHLLK